MEGTVIRLRPGVPLNVAVSPVVLTSECQSDSASDRRSSQCPAVEIPNPIEG